MDAADYEVSQAVKFGADVVTILGMAEDALIKGAVEEAHKQGTIVSFALRFFFAG